MELNCTFLGYRSFVSNKDNREYTIANFANDSLGKSFECFVSNEINVDWSKIKFLQPCVLSFSINTDSHNQLVLRLVGVVV